MMVLNQIVYTPSQAPPRTTFQGLMPDSVLYARNLRHLVGQKRAHQRMYNAFLPHAIAGAVQDLSISSIDWQYIPGWSESLLPFLQTLPCFTQLHLFYTANTFYNWCCDSMAKQAALLPNLGTTKHQESAAWMQQSLTALRNDVVCFLYDPYTLHMFEPDNPLPYSLKYALIFNDVLYINPITLESRYILGSPKHPLVELPAYLNTWSHKNMGMQKEPI